MTANGFDARMESLFAPVVLRSLQVVEDEFEDDIMTFKNKFYERFGRNDKNVFVKYYLQKIAFSYTISRASCVNQWET